MPKYTPNLNIQLADPATDGNQTFNIETMINDPVEKLDEALGLVPVSGDVRVATTGNIVLSGAQTIDGIALAAGNRVLVKNQTAGKENGIYTVATGPWTRAVDANSTAKLAAGINVYVEEGAANGKTQWQMTNTGAVALDTTAITFEKTGGPASATDAIIGSRTVSDTTAPTGDTGTVTTLFGWLANMVKAITGGATWRTLPGMSIAAIKSVLDAATNLGTASTLMKRDASGRAQVAAPSAAADIARKDTVDGAITAHKAEADPHTGYVKKSGDNLTGTLEFPLNKGIALNGKNGMYHNGTQTILGDTTAGLALAGSHFLAYKPWGTEGIPTTTVADITYYVRADGNNTNQGTANTSAGAFRTLNRALSLIPQTINHNVTIYVLEGEEHEAFTLAGLNGRGTITIRSTSETVRAIVPYIRILDCACAIGIINLTVTFNDVAVAVYRCIGVTLTNLSITQPASTAAIYAERSKLTLYKGTISNRVVAVYADAMAEIWVDSLTGTGNTAAYTAIRGGRIIVYYETTIGWTTAEQNVGSGGIVQHGPGVINPWGDNTHSNRVIGQFTHNAAWYATANTDNYMPFNTAIKVSAIGCWDMGTLFKAPQTGWYTFILTVNFYNATAGTKIRTHLVKNGNYSQAMGEAVVYSGYTNGLLKGTARAYFDAGETAQIVINPTISCMIHNEMQSTNLTIGREF
jgi:hypothetical protein